MKNQVLKFKKKRQYLKLAFGLLIIIFSGYSFVETDRIRWTTFVYLAIGGVYMGEALWNLIHHYGIITETYIKEKALFGSEIAIPDITKIKKFTDEYTLETPNKKLVIRGRYMDKESLKVFQSFYETLELKLQAPMSSEA